MSQTKSLKEVFLTDVLIPDRIKAIRQVFGVDHIDPSKSLDSDAMNVVGSTFMSKMRELPQVKQHISRIAERVAKVTNITQASATAGKIQIVCLLVAVVGPSDAIVFLDGLSDELNLGESYTPQELFEHKDMGKALLKSLAIKYPAFDGILGYLTTFGITV